MPLAEYRCIIDWENVGIYGHPGHADCKGWWWCDEASGALKDSSGQGNDLGVVGSPTYRQAGPKARYLAVGVSSGNRFEIADNASLSITGALTLIQWVYFNSLTGEQAISTKWKETGNQRAYALVKEDAPLHRIKARLSVDGIALSVDLAGTAVGVAETWYVVGMRYIPSTEVAAWLNKSKTTQTTGIPASIFDSTAKFILGDIEEATRSLNGRLGPGGVFARALSDAEFEQIVDRGPYGDISEYIDRRETINVDRGRTSPLETFKIGTCEFIVQNKDKRFTPENTSSPVYGKLVPRRRMQLKAIYSSTPSPLFAGFTKELSPIPTQGPPAQARLKFADALERLMEIHVRSILLVNTLTGSAINTILDEAGWPSADRAIDTGQMTIKYMAWDDIPASRALMEIANAEGGQLYIGADGKVVFEDRHHRAKSPHNSPLATIQDTMESLVYRMGQDLIKNRIDLQVYPRKLGTANSVVGDLKSAPKIAVGQTIKFFVQYRDPDTLRPSEATSVTTPVSGTDYQANSKEDGTGTDLTSQLTVSFSNKGRSGEYTVTNNGPRECFLTKAQVRGTPVTWFDALLVRAEDAATIGQYIAAHVLDSRLRQDYEPAKDEADFFLSHLKDPRGVFDVVLSNGKATMLTELLSREISDRLRFINAPQSLDAQAFIGAIHHEISDGWKRHRTTWTCERFGIDGQAFIVGTSEVGGPDKIWY